MNRLLRVSRRIVPLDELDEYGSSWARVVEAVEAGGGRAWLFRGVHHQDQFLEFIEWRSDAEPASATPPELDDVALARNELDVRFGTANDSEWEEALLDHG